MATVPAPLVAALVPLLIGRDLGSPTSVAQFGLDRPVATMTFDEPGRTPINVAVGAPNFDDTGVYMRRSDDPRVFLVLVAGLRPVVALVGITIPPSS
jgi:hypothetical protein